jgi:hypothetical protein
MLLIDGYGDSGSKCIGFTVAGSKTGESATNQISSWAFLCSPTGLDLTRRMPAGGDHARLRLHLP